MTLVALLVTLVVVDFKKACKPLEHLFQRSCFPMAWANDQEIGLSDLAFAMELEDDARCHQESPCSSDPAARSCQLWWQVEFAAVRASRRVNLLHVGKRQDVSGAH